jgi:hypothetical protein
VGKIRTLYVVNHSHTDIGFTDEQDLCFRQHQEFIDQALDLCEATAHYPAEARYAWTCEVTGMTEKYLRNATPEQRDRFRTWQQRGAIDVAGMQYNLTPLLGVEQMIRSLYPIRRLREEFGVPVSSAIQCDVNGVSWLFADLLPEVGVDFLTMAVNPIRGYLPKPVPAAFWWEGPAGNRILVWNGYHYLFGRSIAKLGDWRFAEENIAREVAKLEADDSYPYDFLYFQATHPIRVDNGPPDPRMPDFVRDWNARGLQPAIQFTTPTAFAQMLRTQHGNDLPTHRGDWLDWWSDGVASSAYETGMNRTTHQLLQIAEEFAAGAPGIAPRSRATHAYESTTLYDEHTWGAFSSIDRPQSRWSKAQWNHKASYAYRASSEAHDLVARGAEHFARQIGTAPTEGMFNLGDLDPDAAYPQPETNDILVFNSLPWDRTVLVEQPELRGGAAPVGVLDCFFPREIPWGGLRPADVPRRALGTVPAHGFAFLSTATQLETPDLQASGNSIENAHYRVTIDPATGSLAEWIDKASGHNFAGSWSGFGLGEYIYETVDDPRQRDALFRADFSAEDFGEGITDTRFVRETATSVDVGKPVVELGEASITATIRAPGVRRASVTYRLRTSEKTLDVDWLLDKEPADEVEAVFIAFPFHLETANFRAEINGVPLTPDRDQLPGTVRDWYPIGHWVDVSDGNRGVTVAPLDAPLVHLGGITTGRWARELTPDGPNVMSWALHNHWMVNFQAQQSGEIPLRYRLTTHDGPCDDSTAMRFAREQATPVVVLRERSPLQDEVGQSLVVTGENIHEVHVKPADFGEGMIVRLQNLGTEPSVATIERRLTPIRAAWTTTPDERDLERLPASTETVTVSVRPGAIQSVRLV